MKYIGLRQLMISNEYGKFPQLSREQKLKNYNGSQRCPKPTTTFFGGCFLRLTEQKTSALREIQLVFPQDMPPGINYNESQL